MQNQIVRTRLSLWSIALLVALVMGGCKQSTGPDPADADKPAKVAASDQATADQDATAGNEDETSESNQPTEKGDPNRPADPAGQSGDLPPTDDPKQPADAEPKENETPQTDPDEKGVDVVDKHPFPYRTPAPSLEGGVAWINTAGPIDIKDLRGKFVLLDFWTYCCINCLHILPELKKLEHAYPNNVVVVGVHSAKFDTEKESDNITQAVLRYDIEHPVVNDAEHAIWQRYGVTGWPALRVIDPEGNLVAIHGGEIAFETLDEFLKSALPYYEKKGVLDESPVRFELERDRVTPGPLKFPGKVLADEASGRLYIADSGHHRIVIASLDGKLIDTIGSGEIGSADGSFAAASFKHPQGMALQNKTLYVADTENHLIRKVDLAAGKVTTIAGTGKQNRGYWPGMDRVTFDGAEPKLPDKWSTGPKDLPLASPWALSVHKDWLYIAMAGPHQIWRMSLDEKQLEVYAGNGREDIADGIRVPETPPRLDPAGFQSDYSSFAQPSGFASDGEHLYVADSEGSAIRAVPFAADKEVWTVVGAANLANGQALFSFGDVDGEGEDVRLQHALGVVHHEGRLYVADTYNDKIKEIDIEKRTATTIVNGGFDTVPDKLDEPAGISYAAGKLYVADTNNHIIRTVDLKNSNKVATFEIVGLKPLTRSVATKTTSFPGLVEVAALPAKVKPADGKIKLALKLNLADGWKINTLGPMRYLVEAVDAKGPVDRSAIGQGVWLDEKQRAAELQIELPVAADAGEDQLRVSLAYFYCREGGEGFCKVGSVRWTLPLEISQSATADPVLLEHMVD